MLLKDHSAPSMANAACIYHDRGEDQFGGPRPRFSNQQWPWESPPLCNAGPHPGTTWSYKAGEIIHQLIEQPGHAVPSTWSLPHLTPPHQSKGPQKFKTPLQVPVFPGSRESLLCRHTSCEKTIRLNFIPLSPDLPQDFVARNKKPVFFYYGGKENGRSKGESKDRSEKAGARNPYSQESEPLPKDH
ncbi:hypothetical protein TNCV_2757781 [Trichonephila clavipes]|nr:hypothetical protein TNCV_2757781 [Trichonephila clavipes]